jgi:hypothetical protein
VDPAATAAIRRGPATRPPGVGTDDHDPARLYAGILLSSVVHEHPVIRAVVGE